MLYSQMVQLYAQVESTTKRLQKTQYISQFLKTVKDEDLGETMLLLQGRAFPQWDERVIGIAYKLVIKAIVIATGHSEETVENMWKQTGDLGETAQQCIQTKKQATLFSEKLTATKVIDNLQKMAALQGDGTVDKKMGLASELLTNSTPDEAKFITRTLLEDLRIGIGDGTIRDAIIWTSFGEQLQIKYDENENDICLTQQQRLQYDEYVSKAQEAYDLTHDFAQILKLSRQGIEALKILTLQPGTPCNAMLYQKVVSVQEAFETVGKPAAIEYKYDGFRVQLHKNNNQILLFTRRLENVTAQFPDAVKLTKNIIASTFILDAEIVGVDSVTKKYAPFQNISQRIKRKYSIAEMATKYPVEIKVFDALFYDGLPLISRPFKERRTLIEKIVPQNQTAIQPAKQIITQKTEETEQFYKQALETGCEGIMIKNLEGIYQPGARVGYGVKLKPVMDALDVAITGAEWGEGKRSDWLSSFTIAVQDENGALLNVGKVGTGIKEKPEEGISFEQLTELLKPNIIKQEGKEVFVKPTIIIEVHYEEIQPSPTYTSGYALRFPRFIRLRPDRSTTDISTKQDLENLHKKQRGRN